MRRLAPWAAICGLTVALMAATSAESLARYRDFRSGWPWDLAWNNQWFWALTYGDGQLSVRPINSWGNEGPSIWGHTHLDPIRALVIPFYLIRPNPETLIIFQNVIIWLILPAAFGLLRSEADSTAVAISGALLVPLCPLLQPLLWNDWREMELGMPFILWAVQGFRLRHRGIAALGVAGMLACREEYGVMLATFALIKPKQDEDIGTTYAWARSAVYLGVGWMLFAFFGFVYLFVSSNTPENYIAHFGGPKPGLVQTAAAALDFLVVGVGSWSILALFAPREAALVLPWLWGVSHGRWELARLRDWHWHHVRYATPIVMLLLAAGLIGYARVGTWTVKRRRGGLILAAIWLVAALGLLAARRDALGRMEQIEWPISRQEAREIWTWIDRVGPEDGVLSCYEVSAPLSSRKWLYSNRLSISHPPGYPHLDPTIRWAFLRKGDLVPHELRGPDFEKVHHGPFVRIYRRVGTTESGPR